MERAFALLFRADDGVGLKILHASNLVEAQSVAVSQYPACEVDVWELDNDASSSQP